MSLLAMTSFLRHAARSTGLTAADKTAAESVLGRGHRLTKAVSNQHTLAIQSVVAALAIVVGSIGVLLGVRRATLVLVAAAVVGVAFFLMWCVARGIARERAQALIAAGDDSVVVSVLARERRRLATRKERERLARSLEELYRDALRWYEILPQFRPPHGVVQLRHTGPELEGLTHALRRDRVRVQGVALTARFLSDGYESPLYANELESLREELNRIRYLLETSETPVDARAARREAA
jgi:hypothetical protein